MQRQPRVVDRRQQRRNGRRGRRRARDEREPAVHRDRVVEPVRTDVRERPARLIEDRGRVSRRELVEVARDRRLLEARAREDIREPAAGREALKDRALRVGHLVPGHDLRRADRGHVRAPAREGRVEALPVGHLVAVFVEAKVVEAGDAAVTRRVDEGHAREAELAVLGALAAHVGGREVRLLVAVRRRDDQGRLLSTAVLGALVAARLIVGVVGVLDRIVAAIEGAVGTVEAIEEVVERGALDRVTDLVEEDLLLLPHKTHHVLQVKAGLADGTAWGEETAVDADESRALADLTLGVVAEEDIEVCRDVRLRGVLD